MLFHGGALFVDNHGSGAIVFVTGQVERFLGATEMRQTHRRHHLGVFAQGRFLNLDDFARIQRPVLQVPLDRSPGQQRRALQAQEQMHKGI